MRVIGAMSGSSLDGIDVACCTFERTPTGWKGRVEAARTVPFTAELRDRLESASSTTGLELARLHADMGRTIGEACRALLADAPAELIASHGHTVFHQPGAGFTLQVGCGATIAALTGLPVVCDLRTKDVALGGQGAPLVPLGEKHLFPEHRTFLNLGGISNIAHHSADRVVGYDVGPCNQALNGLAAEAGAAYDAGGAMARQGRVLPELLAQLDALPFYHQAPPRSLGREWYEVHMRPLLSDRSIALSDRLRTAVEHCAGKIARELRNVGAQACLVTGGGAHNTLLVERLRELSGLAIELPSTALIDHKEAYIFAFLGMLRSLGEPTALASVTGARRDSVGGALYLPN